VRVGSPTRNSKPDPSSIDRSLRAGSPMPKSQHGTPSSLPRSVQNHSRPREPPPRLAQQSDQAPSRYLDREHAQSISQWVAASRQYLISPGKHEQEMP